MEEARLDVWVAEGFRARLVGLTGLSSLPEGRALLIPGCSSVHTFGMRFPIDVAFLRGEEVVAVRPAVAPRRFARGGGRGLHALELAAGGAERAGIRPGRRVRLSRTS